MEELFPNLDSHFFMFVKEFLHVMLLDQLTYFMVYLQLLLSLC